MLRSTGRVFGAANENLIIGHSLNRLAVYVAFVHLRDYVQNFPFLCFEVVANAIGFKGLVFVRKNSLLDIVSFVVALSKCMNFTFRHVYPNVVGFQFYSTVFHQSVAIQVHHSAVIVNVKRICG